MLGKGQTEKKVKTEAKPPSKYAKKPVVVSKDTKQRDCLRCGDPFTSTWKGNRICGNCVRKERRGP